jgi:L,D-transpeptidase YbiS
LFDHIKAGYGLCQGTLRNFGRYVLAHRWPVAGLFTGILCVALLLTGTGLRYHDLTADEIHQSMSVVGASEPENLERSLRQVRRRLAGLSPVGHYIIIDHKANRLYLMRGEEKLLDAPISAGSGKILVEPGGGRQWVFDTPVGRYFVRNKRRNPVWVAPDWSFIEENEPIPRNPAARIQEGMLGEYALDLNAPGYMIHGTLYTRMLGQNVSHGCIRVGRDDLRVLWKKVPVGASVFIY